MRQQVYDRVFKGPPRCGKGRVVNPRTSRCVSTSLPLGAALEAAAKALMAGYTPRACPAGAFDFATGECVTAKADRARVQALRDLMERWSVAEAADIDSAAVVKLVTKSALSSAAGAANKTTSARNLANLQNETMGLLARLTEAERHKAQALRDKAACEQELRFAKEMMRALEAELNARGNNARRNNARNNARNTAPRRTPAAPRPRATKPKLGPQEQPPWR